MTATTSNRSTGARVATLCWLAVLLDGFDLVVLGAVLPSLLDYRPWGLTPASASLVTTVGLVGMTIGALTIGTLTDVVGRRKALIGAVASFSLFTLLCAFAPGPGAFGVLRFLAGLGLGGCLPTAIALVNEFTRSHRGGRATTTVMTGYHVGAVATAALAIAVIPHLGWRAMFVLGALPALVLVPLMLRHLPESASYLLAHGRREEAEAVAARYGLELEPDAAPLDGHAAAASAPAPARAEATGPVKVLFSPAYLRNSLAIWVTSFMGLLLVYGLNTWLPQLMRVAGYDLGAALAFLLVLNVGAVVGLLVAGRVADRVGARTAGIGWFSAAAVFLALLSIKVPLGGIYVMVFLAGVFVFSAQVLVYAFTSANHPPQVRATALGWSAGVGRVGAICGPILGGAVLSAGVAVPWGFYAFAVVGALGAVALSTSRVRRPDALGASGAATAGTAGRGTASRGTGAAG
jgi:MFS transporter, AAHS family, benzoate transport protein